MRDAAWLAWLAATRARLLASPFGDAPAGTRDFHAWHWTAHQPALLEAPRCPAMDWTPAGLRARCGDMDVEVQAGRSAAPEHEHELRSPAFKARMPFAAFLDRLEAGGTDTYLTANNAQGNSMLRDLLAPDLAPLPAVLRPDPRAGFLWIGGDGASTPLHCDLTQNLLIQHVGEKHIRLIPPSQQPELDNHIWVHCRIGWLSEEEAARRGVAFRDFHLKPGNALFIPVGWFHCVRGLGFSVMSTWTSFFWDNNWVDGFPP